MADDQNLKIGIQVTADTAGADKAKQAVTAVTTGAEKAGQATSQAGARAEGAARAWEGLRMSAQGGLQSIVGLGKAASGALQAVVGAVPFAKWIMWGTALVAIVGQLTGTFREWFASTKEGAEKASKPVETIKEQLEQLDRTTTDKLRNQLDGITSSAARAASEIENLRTVQDALNDAQEAISLARIRANATLTPTQKLEAEQQVRETYRTARQQQAADAIVENSAASAREQIAYAESIETAAQAAAKAQKIYDKLAADDEAARKKRIGEAQQKVKEAERAVDESGVAPGLPSVQNDALRAADAELSAAKKAAKKEAIEEWEKEVVVAKNAVAERKKAQDAVTEKATAAAESAKLASQKLQAQFDALAATAAGERKVEQIDRRTQSAKDQADRFQSEFGKVSTHYDLPKNVGPYTPDSSNFEPSFFKIDQRSQQPGAYQTYAPRTGADRTDEAARSLNDAAGAAKENTLDAQPLIDAANQLKQSQQDAATQTTEAVQSAAGAITEAAGQVPPPLDLSPVVTAQGEYHAAVSAAFAKSGAQIAALERTVAAQASQIRALFARA